MEFDREEKQAYALLVRAYDGAPSDRPNMKPGQPNYGKCFFNTNFFRILVIIWCISPTISTTSLVGIYALQCIQFSMIFFSWSLFSMRKLIATHQMVKNG